MSEGTRAHGPQGGRSGERGIEEHSSNDSNTTTVENVEGPKGKGVHPKLVQELLGPATIAKTLDTYSHHLPGMGDQAANAMESALE